MECPLCESRVFLRDYASARAYALLLFGAVLMVLGRLVLPAFLPLFVIESVDSGGASSGLEVAAELRAVSERLFLVGLLALGLGVFDVIMDRSRYCARCGFRARFPLRKSDAKTEEALMHMRRRAGMEDADGHSADGRGEGARLPLPQNQPVGPLIRMLRMKDASMRRDAAETLREVTGQDFGQDADAWDAWWKSKKETGGNY